MNARLNSVILLFRRAFKIYQKARDSKVELSAAIIVMNDAFERFDSEYEKQRVLDETTITKEWLESAGFTNSKSARLKYPLLRKNYKGVRAEVRLIGEFAYVHIYRDSDKVEMRISSVGELVRILEIFGVEV